MTVFETMLQNFLYVLTAVVVSTVGYGAFERYMDSKDKKEVMKSIADTHNTAVSSMMSAHSIRQVKASTKEEPEEKADHSVTVINKGSDEKPAQK